MAEPRAGLRVGEWELGRALATGTFAEVREAASAAGQVIAIKRMHGHAARDPELRALFVAECALTCALPPHPGLVRGLAADPTAERPHLAMELVAGPDLRTVLTDRAPSPAEARALIAGAAAAAAHLHAEGWVHGDLNPANLLVGPAGPVICDLGIARRVGEAGPVRGTAAYMAPEQVRGEPWTGAVDVFALGVMLWELSTGERLFHRGASFLSMAAVIEHAPAALADTAISAPVAAALAADPATRLSAAELAAALAGR
ncbi:MAG: protein kinase [Kofleriaceae bacterium]|nr:protein kinase [Kofleriaceae bacterium]MCL4227857.1 protein kinase [Myxococcales bacterium]